MIETNASRRGARAVLMQQGRSLAFISQALSYQNKVKSVYERELMAIVFVVQKWRQILLENHFIIQTDKKSLKFLLERLLMGE